VLAADAIALAVKMGNVKAEQSSVFRMFMSGASNLTRCDRASANWQ
jgi:hypothetical protein